MRYILAFSLLLILVQVSFAQLSGPLSGTLGPDTYHVIAGISVESGDTLRLMPGTTFTFDGPYSLRIYGMLLAEGTESDSIMFTTDTLSNPTRWRGLRFYGSETSGSRLSYCLIENGLAPGVWPDPNSFGGGVFLSQSSPPFAHCTFSGNSAENLGGGVYCYSSSSAFANCTFSNNTGWGGGVCCDHSSPNFINCIFSGNIGSGVDGGAGYANFTNCAFIGNRATSGGGVSWVSGNFTNCIFTGNSSSGGGGAINLGGGTFRNCVITHNSSSNLGGAMDGSEGTFVNCIIAYNSAHSRGGAAFFFGDSPTFINCILIGNSVSEGERGSVFYCSNDSRLTIKNTIIAFSEGAPAIFFDESPWCRFEHCDIFGNAGGNFDYWTSPWEDAPANLGVIDTANVNGDSCDTYMNIYLDPLLRDIENGDYHLMWTQCGDSVDSPCIDAGDPTIHDHTLDCAWGLGTLISDISAYGGDTVISGISYHTDPILPSKPTLFQNYPNPFNPTTEIQFDLPKSMKVELRIYNILGQEVATLANDIFPAGSHRVSWSATNWPSGIYICRMEVAGFAQTRKMLLVR